MADIIPLRPKPNREDELASLLHGLMILAPRLRSANEGTRVAALLMFDTYLTRARRLGVHRPNPPTGPRAA